MSKISQERVKYLFDYREDGRLIRLVNIGRFKAGEVVGCVGERGAWKTKIDGKSYLCARLVWLWHHGYLPEENVTHFDQDFLNDRIENLRESSRFCTVVNTGNNSKNTSGVKGVSWNKIRCKWQAYIGVCGKRINLGVFRDFFSAVSARLKAEFEYGHSDCCVISPAYRFYHGLD